MSDLDTRLPAYRQRLACNFPQIEPILADCLRDAEARLSEQGLADYLDGAAMVCMIGRGVEPVLVYLQELPRIAERLGEDCLELVSRSVWRLSRTPNGHAIPVFMQSITGVTARLGSYELFEQTIDLLMDFARRTSASWAMNSPSAASHPTAATKCAICTSKVSASLGANRSRPVWRPCKPAGRPAWAPPYRHHLRPAFQRD
ncbi:hypothetical protein Thiowin_04611 [Thiorhodovibrio winogradskyi]|uniref:Uncharacterized protein n=1 Tax=Thiorhodovibrio winogradskyi TaxID=77007 RepID=A0ABZ0SHD6_9GAMM|nr:hypothetical protein [Thiorhodovibrio winogradskyi]